MTPHDTGKAVVNKTDPSWAEPQKRDQAFTWPSVFFLVVRFEKLKDYKTIRLMPLRT